MAATVGLRDLWKKHIEGLGDPRNFSARRRARGAVAAVYIPPALVGATVALADLQLATMASSLMGGLALFAGVLVAVFAQFAAWRTRLDERARAHEISEAPARRAVDGAAHNALVGVLAATVTVPVATIVGLGACPTRLWSALLAAFTSFILILVVLIVRGAFVAYEINADPDVRVTDAELARKRRPVEEIDATELGDDHG